MLPAGAGSASVTTTKTKLVETSFDGKITRRRVTLRPFEHPTPAPGRFITWAIQGWRGSMIASGIPSIDAAIALAIDRLRYPDIDEDDDGEFIEPALVRDEIAVDMAADADDDDDPERTFIHVYPKTKRRHRADGIAIVPQDRCDACGGQRHHWPEGWM